MPDFVVMDLDALKRGTPLLKAIICTCVLFVDGVFLNISTAYARTGSGYVVPSACAKAGIEALTKYVRQSSDMISLTGPPQSIDTSQAATAASGGQ